MQAIILAAGMGRRLRGLTRDVTKCMIKVNGVTLIERALEILDRLRLNRIVIAVGYKAEALTAFVDSLPLTTPIEYIYNLDYHKTNNIHSLFLTKHKLVEDDTLLLESDLIFEESVIRRLLADSYPNLALVAKFENWMDGTVTQLDKNNNIKRFMTRSEFDFSDVSSYYKTVNIYKFSRSFSCTHYVPFLEAYSSALGNNQYYEQVLKVITLLDQPSIKAIRLESEKWYEIDDVQDLDIAESIFAKPAEQYAKFQTRYGGYWRYPYILDFHYLVNPFFPPQRLMDEMKSNFEALMCQYPSGLNVNNIIMADYFELEKDNVVVGNGAAELIKSVMEGLSGSIGMTLPTFDEYPNRKSWDKLVFYNAKAPDFRYGANDLIDFFSKKDIKSLVLVNPDIPTGNFVPWDGLQKIAKWTQEVGIRLIVDESFVDFSDATGDASLMRADMLEQYSNMVVIKSLSKSFGIPGLRLGVLASGDKELVRAIGRDISIWNINSFAEFFMQIIGKYRDDYKSSLKHLKSARSKFTALLNNVPFLRAVNSHANFVLCEILPPFSSHELSQRLLSEHGILIRSLSEKQGFAGSSYCRIAIRSDQDNRRLITALHTVLK